MKAPYYQSGGVTLYHGDCLEILPELPKVDAVITDPPYGMGWKPKGAKFYPRNIPGLVGWAGRDNVTYGQDFAPIVGDDKPFDPSPLIALNCPLILFGFDKFYYNLPPGGGVIVWDKSCGSYDAIDFGAGEIAWKSFGGAMRIHRQKWMGLVREGRREHGSYNLPNLHPNEKPVRLFSFCISMLPNPPSVLLDPYLGSGPCGVAAVKNGLQFIGIEIEEKYCEIAAKRIALEQSQGRMEFGK